MAICSRTVAVAEVNGELSTFISWFIKAKKKPSITKLVVTGMPDGRGREAKLPKTGRKHCQPQPGLPLLFYLRLLLKNLVPWDL